MPGMMDFAQQFCNPVTAVVFSEQVAGHDNNSASQDAMFMPLNK
jgi:hypothetical protein